jgi:hypothetical protein
MMDFVLLAQIKIESIAGIAYCNEQLKPESSEDKSL